LRIPGVVLGAVFLLAGCAYQLPRLELSSGDPVSSVILAADGSVLASVHGAVDRQPVPLSTIPKVLQEAVVDTEDRRFWSEPAVDLRAVLRAAAVDADEGGLAQGGSTIAEQYVKLALNDSSNGRSVSDKLKEAVEAYHLEDQEGRSRLLDLYLNAVYLGSGAYGVQAAAETYFGVPVGQVDLAQAALLAGLIQSPSGDDPFVHPDQARRRRAQVLSDLVTQGHATATQAAAANATALLARPASSPDPTAPYFVSDVESWVLGNPVFGATPQARRHALFSGGLTIRTTLEPPQQTQAETAVAKVVPADPSGPAAALVSVDPATGAVESLVGGESWSSHAEGSQLDLATQAQRQSGSTFKPFVLTTALEHGITLSAEYAAPAQMSIPVNGGTWQVRNYEGEPTGTMDLVKATEVSDNVVFAQLMMQVGPSRVVATAAALGITSPLDAYPSAVLGTNAVNPLEMADAYATLADGGIHHSPYLVSEVDGPAGQVLYRHRDDGRRVVPAAVAYTVDGVLEKVVDQGTGVEARIGRPVAGKTGTTDNWADAWFVGATPQLATGVWVGYSRAETPMVPPIQPYPITGGTWPARIYQLFASAALANQPVLDFPNPPSSALAAIAGPTGLLVDNVIGFPLGQAVTQLSRDGFLSSTATVDDPQYPPGYVVGQRPVGGQRVPGGTTVYLQVSG
jgi:penicillin-binding protein 1A